MALTKFKQRTVLLDWELGAGLGHARRLLSVAKRLKQRGFRCVVAVRELWGGTNSFYELGVPLLQAPHHQSQAPPGFKARGYADIAASAGFQTAESLWPVVLGWEAMIDIVQPDVIVADFSPLLAVAAYGRIPLIAIGDGFVLPPPHLPEMPRLRDDGSAMASEAMMLANVAIVQGRRGLPVPSTFPALVGGAAHVVCTYPETDVYAAARLAPALGPLEKPSSMLGPSQRAAIFAYLAADFGGTAKLLQALCNTRLPVTTYVRDLRPETREALVGAGIVVHSTPPPLEQALQDASLVVHHGGIGTVEECLALGRAQLLLPRHLEQTSNAAKLIQLGVGLALGRGFSLAEAQERLVGACNSAALGGRAQETAKRLASSPASSIDTILAHCEVLSG